MTGYINSFETFGLVDGPGVRFVVFLQGCRMRCRYCHNPETWALNTGEEWTPQALVSHVMRYKNYWAKNGGITVSGGEPLLQLPFVTEFFRLAKAKGIHTTLDTCGQPFSTEPEYLKEFDELLKYTDLVILDLKDMDKDAHADLTGHENGNILAMAKYLSDKKIPLWIRHVLVPGLTDKEEDLVEMDRFIKSLDTVERVEILPYHTLGLFKWDKLGIPYSLKDVRPPTAEDVERAEKLLHINSQDK